MKRTLATLSLFLLCVSVASAQDYPLPEDQVQVELGRSAEQYFNLGNWYAERDQHVKAVAYYKAALKKKPDYTETLINMGSSLRALKRFDEAIAAYNKALELGTDVDFVYLNLGNAYLSAGRLREAALAFRTYTQLQEYDPAGYARLAFTLYRLKEYSQAAETFERLVILGEDVSYNLYQAARCYAMMRDYDKTLEKIRAALKADPNIRFVLMDEPDFHDFRRSSQFRELLEEFQSQDSQKSSSPGGK